QVLQRLMEFLRAFLFGGLKSEESPFPRRESATKHRDLGILDVLEQQSRSFDIAGLADIRGNFIFRVDRFADPTQLFLILQISDEFPEILEGHGRCSKFSENFTRPLFARLPARSKPYAAAGASP